ncbi:hypothetical protein F5Y18DRAFT_276862 [Xylariaceae sp. FL1019]|nr:hypothetical protein F5Y18DRAFT_276862 [Xylariaceae sp. FL1019]
MLFLAIFIWTYTHAYRACPHIKMCTAYGRLPSAMLYDMSSHPPRRTFPHINLLQQAYVYTPSLGCQSCPRAESLAQRGGCLLRPFDAPPPCLVCRPQPSDNKTNVSIENEVVHAASPPMLCKRKGNILSQWTAKQ